LFFVQSLAEWAQSRTGLLREAANAHAEAAVAHEAKQQTEVAAAREIQRVKEVMARQAHKEAADLRKKLQDAEQKAKDAAADLQVVVEGKSSLLPWADSVCFFVSSWS
jgi:DNA gyrase/topoisomerase IV subunit B